MTHASQHIIQLIKKNFDEQAVEAVPPHEWGEIMSGFAKNRLFPLAYERIASVTHTDEFVKEYEQKFHSYRKRVSVYLESLGGFCDLAHENDLRFITFKGIPLSLSIYDNIYTRQANDIDILVSDDDLSKADFVARSAGFLQPADHVVSYENKDELLYAPYPFKRRQHDIQVSPYYRFAEGFSVKMEIHTGLRFGNGKEAAERLYWRTRLVTAENTPIETFDPEITFLILLANACDNSESIFSNQLPDKVILRDYVDLHYFLEKHKDKICWANVKSVLIENNLTSIAAQAIGSLSELFEEDASLLKSKLSIEDTPSIWEYSLLERVFHPEKRTLSADQNKPRIFYQEDEKITSLQLDESATLYRRHLDEDVSLKFCVSLQSANEQNSLVVHWSICDSMARSDTLVFRVSLFSDSLASPYKRYEVNVYRNHDRWLAYGLNKTKTSFGASRDKGHQLECFSSSQPLSRNGKQRVEVSCKIPLSLLGIDDNSHPGSIHLFPCLHKKTIGGGYALVYKDDPQIFSLTAPTQKDAHHER